MRRHPYFLLSIAAAAAVLVYNLWSYCCGTCRLEHFFTLGPAGLVLILLTGAAASVLFFLRRRRWRSERRIYCRCGTSKTAEWAYCPACGQSTATPT